MSNYRPYSSYKNSEVEWIGDIPKSWEVLRIKWAATLRNERRKDSPEGWAYIGLEDVEPETGAYKPTEGCSRLSDDSMVGAFKTGDVLYGKLRPYLRKAIVADRDGICSTEFLVLKPNRATSDWLQRWLLTQDVTQQIEAGCDGAKMPRADWEHVSSIPIPLPPLSDQVAINAVLNRETSRIDALIAKKTRFNELLQEKRQALITHTVTKGLNPSVSVRDSSIEWVGDIPAHWTVSRLGRYATVENGTTPSRDNESLWANGTIPWLGSGEVNQYRVRTFQEGITEKALRSCSLRLLPVGTVIVGMVGQGKTRGMAAILEIEATINQNLAAICPGPRLCSEYLLLVFISAYEQLREGGRGSNQAALNCEILSEFKIAIPPLAEQKLIVDEVGKQASRIDSLVHKTQHSIDLLKERRSALITAAVTGQIDLRKSV